MPSDIKNTAHYATAPNIAYIDGQNLYMGTAGREIDPWKIDLARFRFYLKRKYNVTEAYYFLGFIKNKYDDLYDEIQRAGVVLKFREHNNAMLGKKKGNVDSDIIFHIMKKMCRREVFGKIILVSGDGDYKLVVDFLIEENKFEKILFPDKSKTSSLYKRMNRGYFNTLDSSEIRNKIGYKIEYK